MGDDTLARRNVQVKWTGRLGTLVGFLALWLGFWAFTLLRTLAVLIQHQGAPLRGQGMEHGE